MIESRRTVRNDRMNSWFFAGHRGSQTGQVKEESIGASNTKSYGRSWYGISIESCFWWRMQKQRRWMQQPR
jgi:hypothetical protein